MWVPPGRWENTCWIKPLRRSLRSVSHGPALKTKKRDDAMFAELIGPSQERVYRLALRITRNTEDAEDVQQETLLESASQAGPILKVALSLDHLDFKDRHQRSLDRACASGAARFYIPLEETASSPAEGNRRCPRSSNHS